MIRHPLRGPLFTLALASFLGVALIATRTVLAWRVQDLFLVWNLFLAWIPVALALWLEQWDRRGAGKDWRFWLAAFAWLMFFPNAPYILTDLSHLKPIVQSRWWTDLMVILFFAFIGLVLAFISLHQVQRIVARRHGIFASWLFVFGTAFLTGFGVYLGRFERWNSWDVVVRPLALMADSFNWMHWYSFKFTLLFGILMFTTYVLFYSLTSLAPAPAAAKTVNE